MNTKSRIAQTLRSLSVVPSLESDVEANIETGPAGEGVVKGDLEEAQTDQADAQIGESEDKDLTAKTVEVGERSDLETAETEVTASVESDTDVDTTTGDGEAIVKAVVEGADETPADGAGAPGEDKELTVKTVDVAEGTDTESAETEASGEAVVSQEGLTGAILGGIAGFFMIPVLGGTILGAVGGHLVQSYLKKRARLAELQALAFKTIAAGDEKKAKELKQDFEKLTGEVEVLQKQIEDAAKSKKVSTESLEDGATQAAVAAAAAVAEGAAAAAEAAAAAAEAVGGESGEAAVVEEVAEGATVEETPTIEPVDEDAAAIEEGAVEIEESVEVVGELEGHAEKYEQAAATMESLVDALREAQQSGGLTPQSARILTISFESVGVALTGRPFQNERGENALPSLESFGGTMRRDQATQISLESAQDWLRKIWEVLKKTFQQIKEWVVKFIKAVFDQGVRYTQRADKIIASVNARNGGETSKNGKVKLGQAGAKIAIGTDIQPDHSGMLLAIVKEASERGQVATHTLTKIKSNLGELAAKADTIADENSMIQALEVSLASGSDDLRSALFSESFSAGNRTGYQTKVLPGNVQLAIVKPEYSDSMLKTFVSVLRGTKIVTVPVENVPESDYEAPILSLQEIRECCNDVKKIIAAAKDAETKLKAETLEIANVSIPDGISEEGAKNIQKFARNIAKAVSQSSASIGALLKYAVGTSGHLLDYAAASLKQYGGTASVDEKDVVKVGA